MKMLHIRMGITFWIGVFLLSCMIIMAVLSLIWTPHDAFTLNEEHRLQRPNRYFWLGTDLLGRDIFSRMMVASRTVMTLAVMTTGIAGLIGVTLALAIIVSPIFLQKILRFFIDMIMIFPTIILALVLITLLGSSIKTTMIALAIANIPRFTRISLAAMRELDGAEFLSVAKSLGQSPLYIVRRHLLPVLKLPILHTSVIGLASVILGEASLSFLGLGITPPIPSWGYTLNEAKGYIFSYPYLSLAPILCIFITILSLNLISSAFNKK
ncbi:ABC transporter permease [Entomospira entomophila]|uniref:ABC transporter permease n=1 Tax=Entomospira entomophila TaxID=2719988 RepID=A0A968G9H8_9SPIO|nr:ABC transporter permease [Entomospira entomophilus]NIZ40402.1 ABC transporter permease [Entomospira entomophilus]WDI35960.1 ABC transporter permease [Entomospira entomophilus]